MPKQWSLTEIQYLRDNASIIPSRDLASQFQVSHKALLGTLKRHKIRTGRDTRFKAGQVSWNKGKSMRLSPATEFKKGALPHNTKHDGAISIRRDNSGRDYKYIRVAQGKWDLYHRFLWKSVYGAIPKDKIVTFIDGDSLNCEIDNLKLITRGEHMMRCGHSSTARAKASQAMKHIWYTEKLRKAYGMSAKTGLGKLINSK